MPPRLTNTKRAEILATIRRGGLSTRNIGKLHDVSDATVRRIAKDEGITDAWSRDGTENATRASIADSRARRAAIASLLLDDVHRLRERAWAPYQQPMTSVHGPEILTLDLPPLNEVRAAYTAIGICIDKGIAVERHDTDPGTGHAASMLAGLSDALGAAARAMENTDGPGEGD